MTSRFTADMLHDLLAMMQGQRTSGGEQERAHAKHGPLPQYHIAIDPAGYTIAKAFVPATYRPLIVRAKREGTRFTPSLGGTWVVDETDECFVATFRQVN